MGVHLIAGNVQDVSIASPIAMKFNFLFCIPLSPAMVITITNFHSRMGGNGTPLHVHGLPIDGVLLHITRIRTHRVVPLVGTRNCLSKIYDYISNFVSFMITRGPYKCSAYRQIHDLIF
jgi:hypothetical protein